MKRILTISATAALALPALTAPANAASEERQIAVYHDDLNLGTVKGQKKLERRLTKAARQVCGLNSHRTGTRIVSQEAKRCYAQAKAQAKVQYAALISDNQLGG